MVLVCFQERGEVCVSPRLLPPGKLSFAVGVGRRRDAEDADAQVRGDLQAHTRAVAAQIQSGEDLWRVKSKFESKREQPLIEMNVVVLEGWPHIATGNLQLISSEGMTPQHLQWQVIVFIGMILLKRLNWDETKSMAAFPLQLFTKIKQHLKIF